LRYPVSRNKSFAKCLIYEISPWLADGPTQQGASLAMWPSKSSQSKTPHYQLHSHCCSGRPQTTQPRAHPLGFREVKNCRKFWTRRCRSMSCFFLSTQAGGLRAGHRALFCSGTSALRLNISESDRWESRLPHKPPSNTVSYALTHFFFPLLAVARLEPFMHT
jgi:hypothetical protein